MHADSWGSKRVTLCEELYTANKKVKLLPDAMALRPRHKYIIHACTVPVSMAALLEEMHALDSQTYGQTTAGLAILFSTGGNRRLGHRGLSGSWQWVVEPHGV